MVHSQAPCESFSRNLPVEIFRTLLLAVIAFGISSCVMRQDAAEPRPQLSNPYRIHAGVREGFDVWIVDGAAVRREIFPEFVYGGNAERYPFVPEKEIWIDNAIACEEFEYTLAHELHERALMARKGMSYADAHDSSLALERRMRSADRDAARAHEASLPRVSPRDCDGVEEIPSLPASIRLSGIYRSVAARIDSVTLWIVDGAAVRRDIFPDFGFSGDDKAYRFIPPREIWLDGQISCEETPFSIAGELITRREMLRGRSFDDAYTVSLDTLAAMRRRMIERCRAMPLPPLPAERTRDTGTGKERASGTQ